MVWLESDYKSEAFPIVKINCQHCTDKWKAGCWCQDWSKSITFLYPHCSYIQNQNSEDEDVDSVDCMLFVMK